jgi:putative NADH-flavin reductase
MKITVFGASGGIGTEVVRQALRAGHHVTAVIRDGARLAISDPELETVVADVFDAESIAPYVKGADAVVSALGARDTGPTTVCRDGAAALRWAMRETRVRRVVIVSASGLIVDEGDDFIMRHVAKPIVQRALRNGFEDMRAMEKIVMDSGLEWTIMRPPRLTDKPASGRYRTAVDRNVPFGYTIARADVAAEILKALGDPATIGHTIGLG